MEEMSQQTIELAESAIPLNENLSEAEREETVHYIESIAKPDITEAGGTEIEIKESMKSDNVDDPTVQENIINDTKSSRSSTELQLDGVEGKEEPVVEPVDIELLSQHPSSFIGEEVIIEEENEDDEEEYSIRMSVPNDTDYFDDEEKDQDQLIDTASPEYQVYDRENLLQQYKEAVEERSKIQNQNQQLQHKLAEYFKKKKTDDRGQEIEKNVNDQEQRYLKYMSNLEEEQKEEDRQGASIEIQLGDMHRRCTDTENKVEEASNEFIKFKYGVAADAINSRSGKHIPAKDLEQYRASEAKKEQEVIAVRLENIKLKNRLKKREQQLKAKEELAEGLHLIDFEQLKIENQTYHEKIEERNEELLKLRKKITTTVQVLTHLKEKLQFVQGENGEQRSKLRDIEVTVAQRRDILTRLKQVRDALRIDNNKLKHKAGLLGNKPLLRDYEIRKDEGEELCAKLESLKNQHVNLNLTLQGVKKKIEKSKPAQPI